MIPVTLRQLTIHSCLVVPSETVGSKWGLGGTCVNVGCIPKKLMHTAALMGELIKDSTSYGWQLDTEAVQHSWTSMKDNIQNHIRKLNFGYKNQLRTVGVTYLNKLGKGTLLPVTSSFVTLHFPPVLASSINRCC